MLEPNCVDRATASATAASDRALRGVGGGGQGSDDRYRSRQLDDAARQARQRRGPGRRGPCPPRPETVRRRCREIPRALLLVDALRRRSEERDVVGHGRVLLRLRHLAADLVEQGFVRVDEGTELLDEARLRPLQLVDLGDELHALALGVGDDLLRLQLRVRHEDLGFLAGVRLHVVGQALGGGERLLEQMLALLVVRDARLAPSQLLVLLVELARHLLQLGGAQFEEKSHLALVHSSKSYLAEGLLLQVERSEFHGSEDTPTGEHPFLRASLSTEGVAIFSTGRTAGRDGGVAPRTPFRRPCLTRYIASSARARSDSGVWASSGNAATPMLAVIRTGPKSASARKRFSAILARMRFAASIAWSLLVSGSMSTNSSPP